MNWSISSPPNLAIPSFARTSYEKDVKSLVILTRVMSKVPPPMSYIKKTFEFIDVSLILYKQESEAATGSGIIKNDGTEFISRTITFSIACLMRAFSFSP